MTEALPTIPVAVRPAGPGDLGFTLKTWLLTVRHSSHASWHIESRDFFEGEQREIKAVLQRPAVRALIACPEEDPEVILGFLIHEPGVVHFLYTKADFRRRGIASALLRAAALDPDAGFTASTAVHDSTKGWMHQKYPRVTYNPYVRREP